VFILKEYDLIIIGAGVGLYLADVALRKDLKCAIIEKGKFGGTCLTRGCIPSKILTYPASVIRETEHSKQIGLDFKRPDFNWEEISSRMWNKINESNEIEQGLLNIENLDVYRGIGEFTSQYTLRVKDSNGNFSREIKGKKIAICVGGKTFVPNINGLEEAGYITSETFFGEAFPQAPYKRLAIIGGGAIGVEFAHIFSAFSSIVSIIEIQPHLLSNEEQDISIMLEKQFRENNVDVFTNHKIISVTKTQHEKIIVVKNIENNEIRNIYCDEILVASGISSPTDLLKIENTTIETNEKGWIRTNEFLETSVKNIYALGDINGKFQFRHKANYEAEILINNLFGDPKKKKSADYSKVPWAVYTQPTIAHVGLTEKEARNLNVRLFIGKKHFSSIAKGYAMGIEEGNVDDGFVKIIADKNKKILGVHIIGPEADILLQSFVYLMNSGFSCDSENLKDCECINSFDKAFKAKGTYLPIYNSMVIHPSLSELTAWVLGEMQWSD
jgi:mycothione reductase